MEIWKGGDPSDTERLGLNRGMDCGGCGVGLDWTFFASRCVILLPQYEIRGCPRNEAFCGVGGSGSMRGESQL